MGFGVWLHGARPGLRGSFEGERDWSLLYADLPVMLFGTPSVTLILWALTCRALRGRAGPPAVAIVSGAVAVLTLAVLAWTCLAWLDFRVAWVYVEGAWGVTDGAVGA